MNVEYINPFIEASKNVFKKTTGYDLKVGRISLKPATYRISGVSIVVGIIGVIKGKAMFHFNYDSACKVASAMMMGMAVTELDELSKSALAELTNIILGNTATIFFQKNYQVDITPPSVLIGNDVEITSAKQQNVCIPMIFGEDVGEFELCISFIEG